MNMRRRSWTNSEQVSAKRLLPPIIDGTRVSHPLSRCSGGGDGLDAGTPVNLGYLDVMCTGLGGGLFRS